MGRNGCGRESHRWGGAETSTCCVCGVPDSVYGSVAHYGVASAAGGDDDDDGLTVYGLATFAGSVVMPLLPK